MSTRSDLRLIQFAPATAGWLSFGRKEHVLMPANATRG